MGFFSDLKEDLSQAVNELMPEDAQLEEEEALEAVTEAEYEESEKETYEVETEENDADEAETAYVADEAGVEYETEADVVYEAEAMEAEEAVEEEPAMDETDERAQLDALLDKVDTIEIPEDMDITKVDEEEPEMDLETSMREAFSEKENEEEIMGGNEKKMDYQTKSVVDETAVITASMTINGDIISEGSIDVIGTINGNIDALGKLNITGTINGNSKAAEIFADNAKIMGEVSSEGSVKIGQSSVIIGNISAQSAVIAGAVKGDIDVHGPVVLDTSAIVMGNIKSKAVQINNGAVIEGMCSQCYADVNPTAFFEEYKKKSNKDK